MSKIIEFNQEAKTKLIKGAEKVYKSVAATMGPWGRNVLIEKEHNVVTSTKDGVTVAKSISLEDPIENMAATVIKQAAIKTVNKAGDGTTTSTVLAYSIAKYALERTMLSKSNVTKVKQGIEEAVKEVVKELKKQSLDITSQDQIKQIATISSNGDEEIGAIVAMAMEEVGRDGIVTVEKSSSGETFLEPVEGIQFDKGYKSPYFITDNSNMSCVLNEPYILIYDRKISMIKDLLPLLEKISSENKSLLIIAEDIDNEALATLVVNKSRGALQVCAVKAPEFGDRRTQFLEDIAILTGGTVISAERGLTLAKITSLDLLGKARIATINKDTTTIVDGKGDAQKIEERINSLKNLLEKTNTPYEIEKLQARLGKMVGGVAIINVGGVTEIDMEERKDRIEDALQATKAALEEGILPGAGIALYNAKDSIDLNISNEHILEGKRIIYDVCDKPLNQILFNAGEPLKEWLDVINNNNEVPDISSGKMVDAFEKGIIDPTKVVRCALENAAGAAVTLLLTECVIYEKQSDKKDESFDMSNLGM